MSDNTSHEHMFVHQGVKYAIGDTLPGSGARRVTYYDTYFCTSCLEMRYIRVAGESDTYDKPRFGATPMPMERGMG